MADDQSFLVKALQGIPLQETMPFGAGTTPEGSPTMLSNTINALMGIPERAIKGAQYDAANPGASEAVGPSADAAMALAGLGAPAVEAGSAGIFGGRLARGANLDKLSQAERMLDRGQERNSIRQLTGWHQGPEGEWRFEIPDEQSHMLYPNNSGPSSALFQHSPLYKAYPQLQDVKMTTETQPYYPGDTGSWFGPGKTIDLSSRNLEQARAGALHEMQHAIQHIEGFSPGSSKEAMQYVYDNAPPELRAGNTPYDMYKRVSGEVESRNVERRMNFGPKQRYMADPTLTQDTPYSGQLTLKPLEENVFPFIKALREK